MFPMTITLQNPAQLNAVLAALNLGTAAELTTEEMGAMARAQGAKLRGATSEHAALPADANGNKPEGTTAGKSAKAGPAPGPTTAGKTDAPAKTAAASTPAAAPAEAESQASTAATEAITYAEVAKAITEKAKTDRAHVVATFDSFGAKKGTELKPEQFADFLKALG